MMKTKKGRFFFFLLLNLGITYLMFFLFDDNKNGILDLGSHYSNSFVIKCLIQSLLMTAFFYFTMKPPKEEAK